MPRAPRVAVLAKSSCLRCHKRKKRCDRLLPQCGDCVDTNSQCSFLAEEHDTATYPVAFVRGLEERIEQLERRQNGPDEMASISMGQRPAPPTSGPNEQLCITDTMNVTSEHSGPESWTSPPTTRPSDVAHEHPAHQSNCPRETLAGNLKTISLAAMAEPYLGSMAGLSFAKLTQTVLRRLAPDGSDFVFSPQFDTSSSPSAGATSLHMDIRHDMEFDYDLANIDFALLAGDVTAPWVDPWFSAGDTHLPSLPGRSEVMRLATFYFDHSHTLYPIVNRSEVMADLQSLLLNPEQDLAHSPSMFRAWMVLAIGSTAHSSITLAEEASSRQYYDKAMTYFEPSMDCGDIVALEAIMLQVSFSFFNQLGPNTWFLVGTAARLALGMGLHCDAAYASMPKIDAVRKKRLFFSIYMMDRLVSITLGRPFAIHEDDIDITPFAIEPFEGLDNDSAGLRSSIAQPPMAVTAHILRLRKIANDMALKVYCKRVVSRHSAATREEISDSLHRDLLDWRQSVPFPLPNLDPQVPQGCTTWYDLNFYTHLTTLYRPSPLFPTLDVKRLNILAEAAAMALRHANSMHMQQRLAFNWLNMLVIYNAVVALVYSVTVQPQNIATAIERSRAVEDLELAIGLFKKLSHKFSAATSVGNMVEQIIERYKSISSG